MLALVESAVAHHLLDRKLFPVTKNLYSGSMKRELSTITLNLSRCIGHTTTMVDWLTKYPDSIGIVSTYDQTKNLIREHRHLASRIISAQSQFRRTQAAYRYAIIDNYSSTEPRYLEDIFEHINADIYIGLG